MSRGPRILVAGAVLGQPMGGVRRHNAELLPRVAARLAETGGRLAILEGSTPVRFTLPEGIERIASEVPYQPAPMRAALEARALRAALDDAERKQDPFHIVHTGHLPAPRRLGTPFTLTIHDLRSIDLDRAPFTKRLIGRKVLGSAFGNAARIGVVSEWMKGRVHAEFGVDTDRIHVIGNGCDHLPLLPREPDEEPFLLHVGHIEPRKNLDLLLRALALDETLPRLVLAGRAADGARETLARAAAGVGVGGRVTFAEEPTDAEIARLYATCSCAVFPSRLEGFGIGPAEALRAGCPVAASRIPAHVELLGSDAALFDVDDAAGVPGAIRTARQTKAPAQPARTWDDCADAWAAMWRAACAT